MNGYGSYGQPAQTVTQKKPSAYGQQQYSPTGNSAYQPAIPQQQQPRPPSGGSGDYSAYSPQPAQRAGYSPQQIRQSMNQYNAGGKKGNWQSYLPSQAGGYSYGDDMPIPPSAGGLRAYSDYQPPTQGGYQPDPRIIQPYQPAIPPVSQAPQPFDYGGMPPQSQQGNQYSKPTLWAYSQQQPQYSPPSQMPQSAFNAQYGQYGNGGGYASTPNIDQRDAFIQRLNDSMGGYQANSGVYLGQGAPPSSWGQPPQVNVPQMWTDAGSMVQNGWKNPLMGLA